MNVKHKFHLIAVLTIIIGSGGLLASAAAPHTPLAEGASLPAEAAKATTPTGTSTRGDISNGAAEAPPAATADSLAQGAILIDHTCTDLSKIPDYWIEQAKELAIHYAHTSHGSQINSGLETLDDPKYDFSRFYAGSEPPISLSCEEGALCMYDGNPPETYITPEDYWSTSEGVSRTQSVADTGLFDYSMWSWCGQQSSNPTLTVQLYLDTMAAFEVDYPNMRFILMTGHTDGGRATLTRNNNMVRQYAIDSNKVLFDFADIESYDPDGNYYPGTDDSCPWCFDWCAAHPEDCTDLPSCAHSHGFNCMLKGQAFWWMMARLAGWEGQVAEQLDITVPNGGESWPVNSERQIRWSTTGAITQVNLAYSTDGFVTPHVISSPVANTSVYTWTTPLTPTHSAQVRVASIVSPTVISDTSAVFTLYDPSTLTNTVYLPIILRSHTCSSPSNGALVQPSDLVYQGAFRLPDSPGTPENVGWEWSNWASAMAYYPAGDPDGPADGYPGSIFGVGHDHTQYVSEISIPAPVNSAGKNLDDLNTAETLQDFYDIRGGLFGYMEMPRVGLAYLPPQGEQTTGKLYFAWAPHLDEGATNPSHGWCELNLSDPQPDGVWRIGDYWNYVTGDYLFAIPQAWASTYTPGQYLATGRFRDGGQGGEGPSLFAYGPWNEGNPPISGTVLSATPLLLYGDAYEENPPTMNDYHHSDEWTGAAWLTTGAKSAVIFAGTKGQGDCWYGCADGTDTPPWPPDCDRGWWSASFVGQILFYDPADLAAVAGGEMESYEPQPYATLDIDAYLYHIESSQQKYHLGAASFDRARGLLYIFEPLADGDKSLVHVWRVE